MVKGISNGAMALPMKATLEKIISVARVSISGLTEGSILANGKVIK